MKLQVQLSALRAPQHPQASCALLAPKQAVRSQPRRHVLHLTHGSYTHNHSHLHFFQHQQLFPKPLS